MHLTSSAERKRRPLIEKNENSRDAESLIMKMLFDIFNVLEHSAEKQDKSA